MTKEEKIKEAYADYWEIVKKLVDKNGWIFAIDFPIVNNGIELEYHKNGYSLRPKSLQGIENNNGWIKIESEDDLPKDTGYYDFQKFPQDFYKVNPVFWLKNLTKKGFFIETYTHYQPIIEPKPPVY